MGEIVPLVNPLPAELAVTIGVRLRPSTFFAAETLGASAVDVSDDRADPALSGAEGALAFYVDEPLLRRRLAQTNIWMLQSSGR